MAAYNDNYSNIFEVFTYQYSCSVHKKTCFYNCQGTLQLHQQTFRCTRRTNQSRGSQLANFEQLFLTPVNV